MALRSERRLHQPRIALVVYNIDARAPTTGKLSRWHGMIDPMVVASQPMPSALPATEGALVRVAVELGALRIGGELSPDERQLVDAAYAIAAAPTTYTVADARAAYARGEDPLGDELIALRSASRRRAVGAFYTPTAIVEPMVEHVLDGGPARVVDAGCGSGRFAAAAARRRRDLPIVAVDLDPIATLLTRANLAAVGAKQVTVIQGDFLRLELPPIAGRTAWTGNPPYLRHHSLDAATKAWAAAAGKQLGHPVSSLAGLHALFFLATALHARADDFGAYIVSSEWMDTGYGDVIRQLLTNGLAAVSLHSFPPSSTAFDGVMTTAVIVTFQAGAQPKRVRLQRVENPAELGDLSGGWELERSALIAASRWSQFLGPTGKTGTDYGRADHAGADVRPPLRLGDIARVHRGQVTGGNKFFLISRSRARELGVEAWCKPAISSAEEILDSGGVVRDAPERRLLLAVPGNVDRKAHPHLDRYLRRGERRRGNEAAVKLGYVASRRNPWWNLGRLDAPPIVASYMARRAPVFALNPDGLVLLNVAHGVWPTVELSEEQLELLVQHLNLHRETFRGQGRTYHGGLEKFEPREMEALVIPDGEALRRLGTPGSDR